MVAGTVMSAVFIMTAAWACLAKAGVSAVPAKFDLLRKRVLLAA